MQTRYYDPQMRRFINADNVELVPWLSETVGQLNLYAYCNDNPVMYTDESGEIAGELATGISVAVFLGIIIYMEYMELTTHVVSNTLIEVGTAIAEAISGIVDYIKTKKNSKKGKKSGTKNPDPNARPGQKKQGNELKSKARAKDNFQSRNGRRNDYRPQVHHHPGHDHTKYKRTTNGLILFKMAFDWFDYYFEEED